MSGSMGDRLDCLPSYIKMKIHKKEINFNKTLGFGFIPKQDKRKKLLLLWQQVSKNHLPVDSFKKIFQRQLSLMIWKKTLTSFIWIEFCFTEGMGGWKKRAWSYFTLPTACWQQYFQLCWYHSLQTHCKISEPDSHDAQYRPVVGLYIFLRHGRRVNAFLLKEITIMMPYTLNIIGIQRVKWSMEAIEAE